MEDADGPSLEKLVKYAAEQSERLSELETEVEILRLKVAKASAELVERESQERQIVREQISTVRSREERAATLPHSEGSQAARSELDERIRSLVRTMAERRMPLWAAPAPKEQSETILHVHSVRIRYLKHLSDGQIDRFLKGRETTAVFRLLKDTTGNDLRQTVCKFWDIENSSEMSLRVSVGTRLDLVTNGDSPLYIVLQDNLIPPELWLIKNNAWSTRLFPGQDDFYSRETGQNLRAIRGGITDEMIEQASRRNLRAFSAKFPGLNLEERGENAGKTDENKRYLGATSTCATLVLFLFTLILILLNTDTKDAFSMNTAFTGRLDNKQRFSSMATSKDLNEFFLLYFPQTFFESEYRAGDGFELNSDPIAQMLAGPLRLRQVRSKRRTCPTSFASGLECYYEYSTSNRDTANSQLGKVPWGTYRSASDTGIRSTVSGLIADYEGDGYVVDFFSNTTTEDFAGVWREMMQTQWVNGGTRALIATATCYDASSDLWMSMQVLVELSNSGGIMPSPITVKLFRLEPEPATTALEVLRLLLSFYLPYFIVTEFAKRVSFMWRLHWRYLSSLAGLRDFLAFALIVVEFAMTLSVSFDAGAVLSSEVFYDFQPVCDMQSVAKVLNIIVLMLLYMRLINTLHFSASFTVVYHTMRKSVVALAPYMLMLMPSLLGLALTAHSIWGAYTFFFSSFKISITYTILASVGIVPVQELFITNSTWLSFFLIYALLMFAFYLVAVFRGVYLDTRLQVRKREGYGVSSVRLSRSGVVWWVAGLLPVRWRLGLQHWWKERKEAHDPPLSDAVALEDKREDTENPQEKDKTEVVA